MRIALVLVLLLGFAGCKDSRTQSEAWEVRIPVQGAELQLVLVVRDERVAHLAIVEELSDEADVAQLRSALHGAQPDIAQIIDASRSLERPLPVVSPKGYSEADIQNDLHLAGARARVLGASRLLLADAARAWEEGDDAAAMDRIAASLRIGLAFAGGESPWQQTLGESVLIDTVYATEVLFQSRGRSPMTQATYDQLFELFNQTTEALHPSAQDDRLLGAFAEIIAGLGAGP